MWGLGVLYIGISLVPSPFIVGLFKRELCFRPELLMAWISLAGIVACLTVLGVALLSSNDATAILAWVTGRLVGVAVIALGSIIVPGGFTWALAPCFHPRASNGMSKILPSTLTMAEKV